MEIHVLPALRNKVSHIGQGTATLLVLLDLLAAFDIISCSIFLDCLSGLGHGGTVLQ